MALRRASVTRIQGPFFTHKSDKFATYWLLGSYDFQPNPERRANLFCNDRATGRWGRASVEALETLRRAAVDPPGPRLACEGATLRYWLPPGNLVVQVTYTFPVAGLWIVTQSAWEWQDSARGPLYNESATRRP